MNRPASVKPDNFFLLIYRALRQRRIPLVLRVASHTLLLVALALVIYAWVMGMQFKHAMEQQAVRPPCGLLCRFRAQPCKPCTANHSPCARERAIGAERWGGCTTCQQGGGPEVEVGFERGPADSGGRA